MAALSHGRITLDVPDDWGDRSTLLFCSPQGASHGVVSLVVNAVEAETAEGLLKKAVEELKRVDETVKVLSQGKLESKLGAGAYTEVTLTMAGVPVREVLGVVLKGGLAFRVTASAQTPNFEAAASRLWEIMRSVRLG
jgi:hypothetical protein